MMLRINDIHQGDCLDRAKEIPDNTIDAIITDPPYGLKFMGKDWDHGVPGVHFWKEFLRVSKPGAHLLAFGGTRTHHRLMVAIEDAGWEIRDTLMWVYGSGFPKSLDVSKAIDKAAGVEREVIGKGVSGNPQTHKTHNMGNDIASWGYEFGGAFNITTPNTDAAKQWDGWGTALKPAWEPIVLARKPLDGTVAGNVLKWGCGGLNIDGCRVPVNPNVDDMLRTTTRQKRISETWKNGSGFKNETNALTGVPENGRFPANLIHDGGEETIACFPNAPGQQAAITGNEPTANGFSGPVKYGGNKNRVSFPTPRGDSGSAARFFYCAKASKSERGEYNNHPTVKPLALMEYLCKLITPPNGIILDPFMGSGSTAIACINLDFDFIGIEQDQHAIDIANRRIIDGCLK